MGSLHLLVTIPQLLNMKSDPVRRLLGRRRRRPRPPGRETHHPHRQAIPEPRHREARVLFQLRDRERISVSESGVQKQIGDKPEEAGTVSQGKFSYPEGAVTYTITWVADENGFQATGDHLPTPPPMPEHVVKMLADLKAAGQL